ncbi:MAG TPA: hypothetical protein VHX39_08980, partial [Acetobacteraceae bacterium]|nr:hypothetical protein [Acetobacteraceae bacterium]
KASTLAASWPELSSERHRDVIATLITRVGVRRESVEFQVAPARLRILADPISADGPPTDPPPERDEPTIVLSTAANLRRVGRSMRLIVPASNDGATRPNASLIKLMGQAHRLREALIRGDHGSVNELTTHVGLNRVYATRVIRLAWLAPEIVENILRGQQPRTLTAEKLLRATRIPLDRPGQQRAFGFT